MKKVADPAVFAPLAGPTCRRCWLALAVLGVFFVDTEVEAQERPAPTIEGAHQFVRLWLGNGAASFPLILTDENGALIRESDDYEDLLTITHVDSGGCTTVLEAKDDDGVTKTRTINWANVSDVFYDLGAMTVVGPIGVGDGQINKDMDLKGSFDGFRLEAAFDFLVKSCEVQTGF